MEKIINSAFDFFAYALPGAFLILSLLILDPGNDTSQDFINFAQKLQTGGSLMLLAVGYVLGFAITPLGRKLYRGFNRTRLFRWLDTVLEGNLKNKTYTFDQNNGDAPTVSVSERFVLVREFSPNNFRHIESWHVYSLMSHNMALVNILIFAFSGARLVFVDNLYLYGPTGGAPISERSPHNGHGAKGRTRAAIAQMVLDAHRQGKVMATIGRASDYYGPGVTDAAISAAFFEAVLAGKTGDLLGNIDLPHTYSYLPDFARALVTLAEYEVAYGRAWHAPNAETITTRQFVGYVEKALGRPVKVRVAGKLMVYMMGLFIPILREFPELMYEFDAPYVVDDGDFRRTFAATGIHTTPWDEGVAATVAWYQARAAKR